MGRYIDVNIENTYEYLGHTYDSMEGIENLLNFNLNMAKDPSSYVTDVDAIMKEAQSLARTFVDENHPVSAYSSYQTTNRLRDSIKYELTTLGGGTGARLYADAVDNRGHKYAGHIEYGFTDKIGIPHGPWPFLRPAMRIAAEASKKGFAEKMSRIAIFGFEQDNGLIQIGRKNVWSQMQEAGGKSQIARDVHSSYQLYGKSGTRWHEAYNGIGYRSGTHYGYRASGPSWTKGEL